MIDYIYLLYMAALMTCGFKSESTFVPVFPPLDFSDLISDSSFLDTVKLRVETAVPSTVLGLFALWDPSGGLKSLFMEAEQPSGFLVLRTLDPLEPELRQKEEDFLLDRGVRPSATWQGEDS